MFFTTIAVIATVVGFFAAKWALKGAYDLGHDDLAYSKGDLLTWFEGAVYEAVLSTVIFLIIFGINSVFDLAHGDKVILTMSNKHIAKDLIFAGISAKILMAAMIIEGIRIRKRYYEFIAPLREIYLSLPKDELVRPSFFELYRLW